MRLAREIAEKREQEARRRWIMGGVLLILGVLLAAGALLGPNLPGPEAKGASLLVIFGIGLTAGGLSCLAVQGGLLTVAVTGGREHRDSPDALEGKATPILWFLGAKLTAYTLLGGLLGALGSLAEPSSTVRAAIMGATALLMIATALHFLKVHPIFRYAIIQPPRFLTRRMQQRARAGGAFAPALLGGMTVFLPCGVTQAMQLLAINSGSPALGAATLFVFVLGTSPLFFSLGYFATRLGAATHARFMKIAAAAILIVALFSLDGALKLGGSPVTFAKARSAIFEPEPAVPAAVASDGVQEVRIVAGSAGYSPGSAEIRSGEPSRIVFSGDGSGGCSLALLFEGKQYYIDPAGAMSIDLPPQKPGTIDYTCAMGMYGGSIEIT
ncbi:MAG: sulfite exporter TauE/SafE family protein [Solirubrobacteraceae bacterium]